MRIGISCYSTFGGSGVVATEVGKALAARGHEIHILSPSLPPRLVGFEDRINFRRVPARTLLGASLSSRMGRARMTIEGKNLADRVVEDVGGFPLPGRSLFVAIETDFLSSKP